VIFEFNGDEMVLVIIGVVRRVNPTMLKDDGDGVSVDFTPLAGKTNLSTDELLLMKLRTASEAGATQIDLAEPEARALGIALERLESLQTWPPDVLTMSRGIRSRLAAII
jgi:hypothetical protein